MVGHLFQNYDTINVRFFATYTCDLSSFVGFFPKYVYIFFPCVCSTQTYAYIYIIYIYISVWLYKKVPTEISNAF